MEGIESYDMDFDAINEVMDNILNNGYKFEDFLSQPFSFEGIGRLITGTVSGEWGALKGIISQIIIIIIFGAVFINFSRTLKGRQVSEAGFYITYMLLFTALSVTFSNLYGLSFNIMNHIKDFMTALIPTFFMAVTYASGSAVSVPLYQGAAAMLGVISVLLIDIFLPMVNIFFIIAMLNPLFSEDYISKLIDFLERTILFGLKAVTFIFCGINAVQGMIIPAGKGFERSVISKSASMVPGIGNTIGQLYESAYGAGKVIKNGIGTAGIVVLITICAVPLLRIILYGFIMQVGAVTAQPLMGDTRVSDGLGGAYRACRLLGYIIFYEMVMFIVTIAVVIVATGLVV